MSCCRCVESASKPSQSRSRRIARKPRESSTSLWIWVIIASFTTDLFPTQRLPLSQPRIPGPCADMTDAVDSADDVAAAIVTETFFSLFLPTKLVVVLSPVSYV